MITPMKIALLLSATLTLASYASAQSPVTAVAGNNLTQVNKTVTNAPSPAKPPSKPGPPSKKPSPGLAPAKPVVQSSNNNQLQSANSNSNANGNTNTNKAAGGAGGSGSGIGIAAGGTGGKSSAANNGSTTGTNSVDLSDHSVSNTNVHELFIPPVVPPTPPSSLAVGNVVVETSACGPLQRVVKTPVDGVFYGLFKNSKTPLGFTEELAPYVDEHGDVQEYKKVLADDGYTLYGHQVTQYTAILGVSAGRSSAVGGGAGSGSWGQAGLGTTSSNQRLITNLILRSCEIGTIKFQPVETSKVETTPQFQLDASPAWEPANTPYYVPDGAIVTVNPVVPTVHKAVRSHHKPKHHDPACVTLSVR
jgi:hypothetical protein